MNLSGKSKDRALCIVVVDDDWAVRDSLTFSLVVEGFTVHAYADAVQLLAQAPLPVCDCFIVDQNMPGMTGLELIATLRARDIRTPAILITGHPNKPLRERAAASDVPVVEKPLLEGALLECLRQSTA